MTTLTAYLTDGGKLTIANADESSLLDLREAIDQGESWLTFDMDGATVLVNAAQVVRFDIENRG